MSAAPAAAMALPPKVEEPKFRFVVHIMPPRRPSNSLFRRLQKAEEPLHTFAVPARASETFADVWKNIRDRYERNYSAEEVAKGWFHKLQDRYHADIDTTDGVGELGYNKNSDRDDLVLYMLQNAIDRDGSVPDTSGLRPTGFSRPVLNAEQEQEAKRRKLQEERYGAALEDVTEDTPIDSRERSLGPGSPEMGAQSDGEEDDTGDGGRKVDADGFAVPALPGRETRKRKRSPKSHGDVIQSSMEGENDEDILVEDSQNAARNRQSISDSLPKDAQIARSLTMHSVPAEAAAGTSATVAGAHRAQTTAPRARADNSDKSDSMARPLASTSGQYKASRPGPPPTPKPVATQGFSQQPPESAQRPKPTPPIAFTPVNQKVQHQVSIPHDAAQDDAEFDLIEDDELLLGIGGTAEESFDDTATSSHPVFGKDAQDGLPAASGSKPGKLPKPNQKLALTPGAKGSQSKITSSTPGTNALELLSGTQDSAGKNPRSQAFAKLNWTPEEDKILLDGLRRGWSAQQIMAANPMSGRTSSAVRGRRALLLKKHPNIALQKSTAEPSDGDNTSVHSASKRAGGKPWSVEDVHKMSCAIAEGYDALEIQVRHFPNRSEDSVNRKVHAIQGQVWKTAAKKAEFPENEAKLEGWTLKDSCKVWRTNRAGYSALEAAKRFFGRWEVAEVQKQLDAYAAKRKRLEVDQACASQAGKAFRKSAFDSSQLLAESSRLPQSSPVERSMQARAARRSSVETPRTTAVQVPSSPPQTNETGSKPSPDKEQAQPSTQAHRSSSPTVQIPPLEQASARQTFSRSSSGHGKQSTLNFSRDKGKQRAGPPRPASEELDAQYSRRPAASTTARPATQPHQEPTTTSTQGEDLVQDAGADSDDDDHTPADDLEMLDAGLDNEAVESYEDNGNASPKNLDQNVEPRLSGLSVPTADASAPQILNERKRTGSKDSIMQSPVTTREETASTSSGRRRSSRFESGVDTRVAAQLSQELNRSLSREKREDLEEAAHEDQVLETPDPKVTKYHRASSKSRSSGITDEIVIEGDAAAKPESQAFQTQDPATSRSQRTLRSAPQAKQTVRGSELPPSHANKTPTLQPSPQIGSSESGATPTTTPATTPAQSGRLPARGQSYASRIRDLHRPQPIANASAKKSGESPTRKSASEASDAPRSNGSPTPTDASIWEETAGAVKIGRNRQEYFEDLKISKSTIRAIARGDWDEVRRLKAEEKRLHRQRKIARGDYVLSKRDAQHRDGPAQGGDADEADEDVIRVDDNSDMSSDVDEDYDEKIWSDSDFEQPQEIDRDRHFSEVEDDDDVPDQVNNASQKKLEGSNEHDGKVDSSNEDEPMVNVTDRAHSTPQANGIGSVEEHEEEEDELELPTVATMPSTNGDTTHALTDDNLQELNNSGDEGSPTRLCRKRKASEDESSPKSRRNKQQSDDRTAMPPPRSVNAPTSPQSKPKSKRKARRQNNSSLRRSSDGRSERSSSFGHQANAEAPQQQAPSTPLQSSKPKHQSKKPKLSEATPVTQSPKWKTQTPKQPTAAPSQKAPVSSVKGSQRSNGGGLSGLVRKAHIPTPPKVKRTPQKETKGKKLDPNADDDESDDSSGSE